MKRFSESPSHEDVRGQLLEQIHEREKLHEALTAVTNERDQLKLDLHDNIEMVNIRDYDIVRKSSIAGLHYK